MVINYVPEGSCVTRGGGAMLHGQKTARHKTGIRQGYLVIVGSFE